MSKGLQILPECDGDTTLIEILEYKKPDHQPSISKVLSTLNEEKRKNITLIGVIDDDKRKPQLFSEYNTIEETKNLIKRKHPERNHYLFVLKPALEQFLFDAADQANVDPGKYGFKNLDRLKKICKTKAVRKDQNFKQFVNSLKQKKADSCVKKLRAWLIEILGEDF
ncbi:MAG: hypothetical protein AAFZ15_19265 [Bacteroidota bacterium]